MEIELVFMRRTLVEVSGRWEKKNLGVEANLCVCWNDTKGLAGLSLMSLMKVHSE